MIGFIRSLLNLGSFHKKIIQSQEEIAILVSEQGKQLKELAQKVNLPHSSICKFPAKPDDANLTSMLSRQQELNSAHLHRNTLPNDSAAVQKMLCQLWRNENRKIDAMVLLESGFRVFSQNDEDGIVLRIFSLIGSTNRTVVEIGNDCNASNIDLPENISSNLIVNHGWHGVLFDIIEEECNKIQYFFARNLSTRHFHWGKDAKNTYFSPLVFCSNINKETIEASLENAHVPAAPDLMVLDIDGGDYEAIEGMTNYSPRVLIVEFEKRFRDRYSVIQSDKSAFNRRWTQSGSVSLAAWVKLLNSKGYTLCAIGGCGFNAFFIRNDCIKGKINPLKPSEAFDSHPILSRVPNDFWLEPDGSWREV